MLNFLKKYKLTHVRFKSIYWNDRSHPNDKKFSKILIANRGEIAVRIIETCKRINVKTLCIYSEADYQAKHVAMADESVMVGPASVNQSYLDTEKIINIAVEHNCEAVHPGYGFLSENTEFCKELDHNNIKFIGPSHRAIKAMGDKIESKRIAKKANVNMIPGFDGEIKNEEHAVEISKEIGFPVMIKASAGGGGKGMRIAWNQEEVVSGYTLSKAEAKSSFGDDRMLIEKYIENPRHIEIQVLSDNFGNFIHLNERECSIQRRNQKIIEESPSTFLNNDLRQEMTKQAIMLAQEVSYNSAGTVEFLVDKYKKFYFLEMNTRLQVEHPITECVTGIDIVHQMMRVASDNKLLHQQSDIPLNGWALESRIYAEDPLVNFAPSIGFLTQYTEPLTDNVRCDSGVMKGSEISVYYDPMICKLITYGDNRKEALKHMHNALTNYVISGVKNNVSILIDIINEQKFMDGNYSTNYIKECYPDGFKGRKITRQVIADLSHIVAAIWMRNEMQYDSTLRKHNVCVNCLDLKEHIEEFEIAEENSETFQIHNKEVILQFDSKIKKHSKLNVNLTYKNQCKKYVIEVLGWSNDGNIQLKYEGKQINWNILAQHISQYAHIMKPIKKYINDSILTAPMPGIVKRINVNIGDKILKGSEVCVLEAMKMQNGLYSKVDGTVSKICVNVNDSVNESDILIEYSN